MEVRIADDFDLEKIAASGQCFRMTREGSGWRIYAGARTLYIREKAPGVYVCRTSEAHWGEFWRGYFDLGRDYAAIRAAIPRSDRFLREAADYSRGIRILRQEPFETLVTFILSQRKSIPAIRACVEALAARYGKKCGKGHAFPAARTLARATESELRALKLGYRAPYALDAAKRAADGRLALAGDALSDEALLERLMSVKGVGIKVASCVGLFAYGRYALAPVDTWIGKIIDRYYGGRDPFPAMGAYAGIYQQYAFYYSIRHKELFS